MKASVHYVDQLEFRTFLQKENIFFPETFNKGNPAKKEYNDDVYSRKYTTALLLYLFDLY